MKIHILIPGKSKEKHWNLAQKEYEKRLSVFADLKIVHVAEEKPRGKLSEKDILQIKEKEAHAILRHIPQQSFLVFLDSQGKSLSSEDFADFIKVRQIQSTKNLVFVIGGFLGLSDEIKKRADLLLSFSAMTFTHQMMPILLLEQIYRGYSIIAGSPYHK